MGKIVCAAAFRETGEELGIQLHGDPIPLTPLKQKSGKIIYAGAIEKDFDPKTLKSNQFSLEWPPKSGKINSYPEIDKVAWFSFSEAKIKILKGQMPFITELETILLPH